jgi:methionyl-tRNA formyltransferase
MTIFATTDELCAGDMMARAFVTAAPEDTLGELAEHLAEADAGSALVVWAADGNVDLPRHRSRGCGPSPSK